MLIHSGSHGLGHQVCTDSVKQMDAVLPRYGIVLPARQLACAPQSSPEGRTYIAAMAAAANFAWANRHAVAHPPTPGDPRLVKQLGRRLSDREPIESTPGGAV